MAQPRHTGTVKWFNVKNGYGFITPDEAGQQDLFVHISALKDAGLSRLETGDRLEYEIANVPGKEGRTCAGNIKLV